MALRRCGPSRTRRVQVFTLAPDPAPAETERDERGPPDSIVGCSRLATRGHGGDDQREGSGQASTPTRTRQRQRDSRLHAALRPSLVGVLGVDARERFLHVHNPTACPTSPINRGAALPISTKTQPARAPTGSTEQTTRRSQRSAPGRPRPRRQQVANTHTSRRRPICNHDMTSSIAPSPAPGYPGDGFARSLLTLAPPAVSVSGPVPEEPSTARSPPR